MFNIIYTKFIYKNRISLQDNNPERIMQCKAMPCNAMQCNAINTIHYNTIQLILSRLQQEQQTSSKNILYTH